MARKQGNSTIARSVGGLFLISTIAYMVGSGLIETALAGTEYLQQIEARRAGIVAGVLLQFVNDAAVVAIGVLIFPLLKQRSERIALGYLAARVLECGLLAIGGVFTLMLLGAGEAAPAAGAALLAGRVAAYQAAMIALAIGSVPACAALYRARLIPPALAALGVAGYAVLLAGTALEIGGQNLHFLHTIAGGLFELILPIWLIARGFNAAALAPGSEAARQGQQHTTAA